MLNIEQVYRHYCQLKDNRLPWDALWGETARYYLPTSMHWQPDTDSRVSPNVSKIKVFDDTPAWAAQRFASGLLGMVMNPTQKWLEFELYSGQDQLSDEARAWLQRLQEKVLFVLQDPTVGFYDAMHEHLLDYGIFGEAIMLIDRNPENNMPRFTPYPLEQTYLGLTASKRPNTVFRRYHLQAQTLVDTFSKQDDSIPDVVLSSIKAKEYTKKFAIIHGVFPREHGVANGFQHEKPFASVYFLEENKQLIRESGFDFFPFSAPRFMVFASEDHGQGPGVLSLSNVRSLNTIIKTMLRSDQRKAAPAWLAQRRGWVKPLNLNPDHINYYDGFDLDKTVMPLGGDGDPQAGKDWVDGYRESILRAFYLDRMNAPDKRAEMKEVEVLMGEEERMRDLLPQLSRLHAESISQIILNVVDICADEMEPPPEEIGANSVKIRYLSPLSRAQKSMSVAQVNRTLQNFIIPLSQIDPSAMKTVNIYKYARYVLDAENMPSEIRTTEEEFAAMQEQDAQQAQMQQMLEAGQGASEITKNFAQAQQAAGGGDPYAGLI